MTVLVIRMRMTRMQPRKRGCLATMREARFGTLVNRCVQQDDDDYVCRQPHQPVPIHPLPRSDPASSPSIWMEPTSSSSSSSSSSSWSQHHHHSHRKEPRDHHCRSPPGCSIIEKITCAHCSAPSASSHPPLSPLPWSRWSVRWGWSSRSSTGRWRRSSSAAASPTRPLVLLASYSSPPDDDVYIMMMGLLTMIVMVAVLIVEHCW